jgi:hypothetical protein
VPRRFWSVEIGFLLDGGTIRITGLDEDDHCRLIALTQYSFEREGWTWPRPGRLYLGPRLVPMRSDAEREILALVERLLVEQESAGPDPDLSPDVRAFEIASLREILEYVRSEHYGRVV